MNNYYLDSRKEVITNNAYQNIFKYTDKLIRTKDEYIDNVINSEDVLNAKTIDEKLSMLTKDSLDYINKKGKFDDNSPINKDKEDYLLAMERSPIKDTEIKHILNLALTDEINNHEVYMKGIDQSYNYEGYITYKTEEL